VWYQVSVASRSSGLRELRGSWLRSQRCGREFSATILRGAAQRLAAGSGKFWLNQGSFF
jgi:hypothetical protein